MDYKDTVNLLDTPFPMRGDLAKREPGMLQKWLKQGRYRQLRQKCAGRDKFILHDGPPYANGQLHLGHASNKILKDIILRSKTLAGFDAPYGPGWDCHGLPIELNIEKQFGKNLAPNEFRAKCREYANSQIEQQKVDFMRLGVLGDWDQPYKTMDFTTEAGIIRALGEIYQQGYLFSGVKPVYWCIDCGSALAEAEVEYYDKESPAIDVAFAAVDATKVAQAFNHAGDAAATIFAVIWTTTPWTLPANRAICAGPEVEYALVKTPAGYLIIATTLVASAMERYGFTDYSLVATTFGKQLELLEFAHPFYARTVPLILGEHATADAGTGLVHTAPAHGMDDYVVGLKYNLDLHNPVGNDGCYLASTEFFAGLNVFKANEQVIAKLTENQRLLKHSKLTHSYPCCWRHKSKIIFRTTGQWFIGMDKPGKNGQTLREQAGAAVSATDFFPAWGRARLDAMINNRPDWCVSRQRSWGVPMPFFVHKETGELHPNSYELLQQVAAKVEQQGIDAWFNLEAHELLPAAEVANYVKLKDTLDVWFDSGTTHYTVLGGRPELRAPADLYLEGSDQHRGWFQSSLLLVR
jgi:isoleucyl-tRNA synthetase